MRAIALAVLMTSLPALACPNLAGKYASCRSTSGNTSGSYDVEVKQVVQNRITTYTVISTDAETNEREVETYRADGKKYVRSETDPESGLKFSLSTTVSCIGNSLQANMVLQIGNETVSTTTTTVTKNGKQLVQVTKGSSMGETINETVTCE